MINQLITAQNGTGKTTLITGIIASYALDLYAVVRSIVLIDRGADYSQLSQKLPNVTCIELTPENDALDCQLNEDTNCLIINYPLDNSNDDEFNRQVLKLLSSNPERSCVVNEAWSFNKEFLKTIASHASGYVMATSEHVNIGEIPFSIHVNMARH